MVDSTMTGTGGSLVQRMIRAARLDNGVYEEVEADRTATSQAATAVVIVAVAGAIGQGLNVALNPQAGGPSGPMGILFTAVGGALGALLGWVIWSYVAHFIGTRFFGGTADTGELLRTIGFAQSPGVLNILAFLPVVGGFVTIATAIWSLVAGVIAIRQALDFDTGKAIMTAVIGWLFFVVLFLVIGLLIAGFFIAVSGTGAG
jgi:hypothetical protein